MSHFWWIMGGVAVGIIVGIVLANIAIRAAIGRGLNW